LARRSKKQKQRDQHGHFIGWQRHCHNPKTYAVASLSLLYRVFFTASSARVGHPEKLSQHLGDAGLEWYHPN
jgi:hypothetical protein